MTTLKGLPTYNMTISDELDGVYKISLVDAPAIESDFLLFNGDEKKVLTFSDDEKHVITGPVMIPEIPIYRCDETGFEYYVQFSKDTIRKSAELFFKNGYQSSVSVGHEFDVKDVYVFESYIVDKQRGIVPNDLEVPDGTWCVSMKCENNELWDKLKNTDLLHGFSIETMNTAIQMAKQESKQDKFDQEERQVEKKHWMDELLNMADQM